MMAGYIDYALTLVFWLGLWTATLPQDARLKERVLRYLGMGRESAEKSALFRAARRTAAALRREMLLGELSESLAYVKNLVVLGRGGSVSAELLLTELAETSRGLSPAFTDMAHYMHMNERSRAESALDRAIPGSYARDVGIFLAGWEDIAPADLLPNVEMFQAALREDRLTRQKKRDELISDLIYLPVVANCMTVLLNFIYIAYFIPQRESMSMLL